jgi:hypothetical protein
MPQPTGCAMTSGGWVAVQMLFMKSKAGCRLNTSNSYEGEWHLQINGIILVNHVLWVLPVVPGTKTWMSSGMH